MPVQINENMHYGLFVIYVRL